MSANDLGYTLGYTIVAPPSGVALVCQAGQCFALRSAGLPRGGLTPSDMPSAMPSTGRVSVDPGDWVLPDSVVALHSMDSTRVVGALASDFVAEHLGAARLRRGYAEALPGLDESGMGSLDVRGTLSLDDTADALAATPAGTPNIIRVLVFNALLDLGDEVQRVIGAARSTGTRVEFVFATGLSIG